jgi:hypothetical protein
LHSISSSLYLLRARKALSWVPKTPPTTGISKPLDVLKKDSGTSLVAGLANVGGYFIFGIDRFFHPEKILFLFKKSDKLS